MNVGPGNRGKPEERGLIGEGVLVIFTSMTLVATIDGGTIIKSTTDLSIQAEKTVNSSVRRISTGLEFVEVTGFVNENAEIEYVEIVVRPYPGSPPINLENVIIMEKWNFLDSSGMVYRTYTPPSDYVLNMNSTLTERTFTVKPLRDIGENSPTIMEDEEDLSLIIVDLKGNPKDRADTVLTIIPEEGFKTRYELQIPSGLSRNEHEVTDLKPIPV